MSDHTFLKEDLIELRNSLGLTQHEMANHLDMALRSYQAIEAGESAYRFIHRLAAERVALAVAVDKQSPELSPIAVREDAVELVRLGRATGHPSFQFESDGPIRDKDSNAKFRSSYGVVGELVLIANALDYQINHVLIELLHLTNSPMLESVIATLDMARKIEMLKARAKHVAQSNWRKPILAYIDKLETVIKWRNVACHTPLIPDKQHGAVFAPAAMAKLLKSLLLEPGKEPTADRIPVRKLKDAINLAERTLGEGQNIIRNFHNANVERIKRDAIRKAGPRS